MNEIGLRQRHPKYSVELRLMRRIVRRLLAVPGPSLRHALGLHFIGAPEMARLNESYLRHNGSTDVLAFDYAESPSAQTIHGEVFVCLDEAESNRVRYRTTCSLETMRYVVHGWLHLQGHRDKTLRQRRAMKKEEDGVLDALRQDFDLSRLVRPRSAFQDRFKISAGV